MKQVIEEDVEFRESNNYNFPTPPHTSPYINGEVFYFREDIIHISHPQLTINHLSKTSTMFGDVMKLHLCLKTISILSLRHKKTSITSYLLVC